MAEIVNLRRMRKARERAESEARASANRLAHGRNKAEKQKAQTELARRDQILDGARRERE